MYISKYGKLLFFIIAWILTIPSFGQRVVNVGIQVSPGYSSFGSTLPGSITKAKTEGAYGVNFGVSVKYFLNKSYGIGSGIQLLGFKQTTSGDEYYDSFNVIDSENQIYERRVWGKNVFEETSIKVLHIPIQLFYFHEINQYISVYGSVGPGISIPIIKECTGRGVFTYKGYYPEDGVLLEDIPVYGFSSDMSVNTSGNLNSKFVFFDFGATAGMAFTLNRYYRFHTDISYYRSLTNLAGNGGSLHLSNEVGSYNSVVNGKNALSNLYFSIGISKDILF